MTDEKMRRVSAIMIKAGKFDELATLQHRLSPVGQAEMVKLQEDMDNERDYGYLTEAAMKAKWDTVTQADKDNIALAFDARQRDRDIERKAERSGV